MVLKDAMQAAKKKKMQQLTVLPSYDSYEPQQGPALHDNPKRA